MTACRVCGDRLPDAVLLSMKDMPAVAQHFPADNELAADRGCSFEVKECRACGVVQLTSAPVPYFRDVVRAAGFSPEMTAFRRQQFQAFVGDHRLAGKDVIEIGCGAGEYLDIMRGCGVRAVGLEHGAEAVEQCARRGLVVRRGYVEAEDQALEGGPFDAFFMMSFLEHAPSPVTLLRGVAHNLVDGGMGLVEVPNLEMIEREQMATEFMTDHLLYFTSHTLRTTLALAGFEVLSVRSVWHDYILSAVTRKRSPAAFNGVLEQTARVRAQVDAFLAGFPERSVAVWGAGHQALATLALHEMGSRVAYVVDSAPFKQGRFTPATHLPVVPPARLRADTTIRAVIVMGGSYSDEIVGILLRDHDPGLVVAEVGPRGLATRRRP